MKNTKILVVILICGLLFSSCKKYLEIEAPKNGLTPEVVFKTNDMATSAVLGLYEQMAIGGYASGANRSLSIGLGLAADEFNAYGTENQQINQNEILSDNLYVLSIWSGMYTRIYNCNAILEGLESSVKITSNVRSQLKGEVLFNRAFNYFYLVNLFGEVPLHLSTDYQVNSKAFRLPINKVFERVILDLKTAEMLLSDSYATPERARPNRSTVQALLARTYLYLQDWENAEKYASLILNKSDIYKLVQLDQVFLNNSTESIWQLVPPAGGNTLAGNLMILTTAPNASQVSLTSDFLTNAFENGDQRRNSWIRSTTSAGTTYAYPYKYKVRSSSISTEYYVIFRLSEQFLIRAEARAHQNNLVGSISDLDAVRFRAGLSLMIDTKPEINKSELLNAILNERRVELFSEWGHRWFDLKRTNQSTIVLGASKPKWKKENILFPIPKSEADRNPNIF